MLLASALDSKLCIRPNDFEASANIFRLRGSTFRVFERSRFRGRRPKEIFFLQGMLSQLLCN